MSLVLFILFLAPAASYKPAPPLKCGVNEYAVPCKTICPPQICDDEDTEYLCDRNPTCIPGCDCVDGYLRNKEKICIFKDQCPKLLEDTTTDPPQPSTNGSDSSATINTQVTGSAFESNTTTSFSSSFSSSSASQFSSSSNMSSRSFSIGIAGGGLKRNCTYNSCTPTCSLPYSHNCPTDSNPCNCPPGTIISEEGGKCVPKEECPKYANCKGDYNASYTDCPIACPSTCAKPDAEYCNATCDTLGCVCNPGHLLTEINGKCIKPEDCPGGNACGKNETFVDCLNKCPSMYCPVDDNRSVLTCESGHRCPSGCGCQKNYKRKSVDEYKCIHATDCPPVNCTRPNEVWNPCPEPCLSDYCSEKNKVTKPGDCPYSESECSPQCICQSGFYRNASDICVTAQECTPEETTTDPPQSYTNGSDSSATINTQVTGSAFESNTTTFYNSSFSSSSASQFSSSSNMSAHSFSNGIAGGGLKRNCTYNSCTPTCSLPYSHNCPPDSNPCKCPPGTIISEEGGKCVSKEECSKYANCKGDYNASYTDCPIAFPSTCAKPDAEYCNATCDTLGCVCNPGHLLTEMNGKCIKPEDCPDGNACRQNETFVDCLNKCPNIYCPLDDNRSVLTCEPGHRCLSGCGCRKNYKRKSVDEYICILASECPHINCTRRNEVWNSCPKPCLSDYCSEKNKVTKPGDCPYTESDCIPQCICQPGFYRNASDICVTPQECPPDLTLTYKGL